MTVDKTHIKYTILKAELKQVDTISRISSRSFSDAFGKDNTKEDLDDYLMKSFSVDAIQKDFDAGNIFYLAYEDNEPVGYIKLNFDKIVEEVKGLKCFQLERIYVLKNYYGLGLGAQLLQETINYAVKHNYGHVWLGVWQKNDRAIKFYKKYNFETVGTKLFKIGNKVTEDYIMSLKIK